MRKHIMLLEMHALRTMLLEDRIAFLQKNYLERLAQSKLWDRADRPMMMAINAMDIGPSQPGTQAEEAVARKLFAYILSFDPDGTKRNSQWLMNLLLKNNMQLEDLPEARDVLVGFMQHQRQLPAEQRDLNRFKNLGDLEAALQPHKGTQVVSQRQQDRQVEQGMFAQADVVYNDARYRILIPKTAEAATYFGVNTRWCTAYTDPSRNMFNYYAKQGPMFIVLDKANNNRWQFHFESSQFMDEMDRQINLKDFVQMHPEVAKFFERRDADAEVVAHMGDNLVVMKKGDADRGQLVWSHGSGKGLLAGKPKCTLNYVGNEITAGHVEVLGTGRGNWPFTVYSNSEEVEACLNQIGMKPSGGIQETLASFDIFWSEGHYGSLADVGKRVLKLNDGYEWRGISVEDSNSYYVLINGETAETSAMLTTDKEFLAERPQDEGEHHALARLVSVLDIAKYHDDEDAFTAYDLIDAAHGHVLANAPHLARLDALFEKNGGGDPNFRKALIALLHKSDVRYTEDFIGDDRLVLEWYSDYKDLVEENGDKSANWFIEVLEGDTHINVHSEDADSGEQEDMLGWLDKETLKKLGEYLMTTQEEWINDQKEYDEDYEFNPTDIDQIVELINEADVDEVKSAFNSAKYSGYEVGANEEAATILRQEIEGKNAVLFAEDAAPKTASDQGEFDFGDKKPEKTYHGKFTYDAQVVVAPRLADIVAEIKQDPTLESWRYEGRWLALKEDKIAPEEPNYGFTDYDEDAAKERFLEEIAEILP